MPKKFIFVVFIAFISFACSTNYEKANEDAVEKLNRQIKAENFDEIYEQSANQVKTAIAKTEFIEKMKLAVNSMKSVDTNLNWKIKGNQKEFYRDFSIKDTSLRTIENETKSINIWLYWDNFSLCGFETSEIKVINSCS